MKKQCHTSRSTPQAITAIALLLVALFSPFHSVSGEPAWPPHDWSQADFGSFSPDTTYSFDGKYSAVQTIAPTDGSDAAYIQVTIYDSETNAILDSFPAERLLDFWGVCWEPDSYNLWIQSGDVGTYCMRYDNGVWSRDVDYTRTVYYENGVQHKRVTHPLHMPDGMIDRYRMRNGSFEYYDAISRDRRFYAGYGTLPDDTGEWCAGVEISDAASDETLFFYPIESDANYRGVCWARESDDLWVRLGDEVFCLAYKNGLWVRDDEACLPDDIALSYEWDDAG